MEVILAKTAGFCFGVDRAVSQAVEEAAKADGPVYTYGPLVHNEEVIKDLESKGIRAVSSEEIDQLEGGIVIIRAHGIPKAEQEKLEGRGFRVIDLTCPFVKRIHRIVKEASEAGSFIVITGNKDHPEVKGIVGWCEGPSCVIADENDISMIPEDMPITIVSQTTFNAKKFKELVEKISERSYNKHVVNTICNATQERQTEASAIAERADVMIVIGGKNSSNSAKLYEICSKECANTQFVQTWRDLNLSPAGKEQIIGITAGASTPKNIIEEVQNNVRADF